MTPISMFIRDLTVIDCSYLDAARGLVGESWIVDLMLTGTPDEQGMMMDFGVAKKSIKTLIDDLVDHKLLVPRHLSRLVVQGDKAFSYELPTGGTVRYSAPKQATCFIDVPAITTQAVHDFLLEHLEDSLPANVAEVSLQLRHENIEGPFYHYSHGLKKHAGNCQRIVHGHRSAIHVFKDGVRDIDLEREVARWFRDMYIGTHEDILDQFSNAGTDYISFGYTASQGEFALTLPTRYCYMIETDSTVEHIARHIADRIKDENRGCTIEVHAYEGFGKGAIAVA